MSRQESTSEVAAEVVHDLVMPIIAVAADSFLGAGGAIAAAYMQTGFAKMLQRRDADWRAEVAQSMERHLSVSQLQQLAESEGFATALFRATLGALETHREEKRTALRNAVINVGLSGGDLDERREALLRLVCRLEPLHVRLLALLGEETDPHPGLVNAGVTAGAVSKALVDAFPSIEANWDVLLVATAELVEAGLVEPEDGQVGAWGQGPQTRYERLLESAGSPYSDRATELGKDFLAFVREPAAPSEEQR